MIYICFSIAAIALIVILVTSASLIIERSRYDTRGFDRNKIHKNGTKFDDQGHDYDGYDLEGYDAAGYDANGRTKAGKYDRLHDRVGDDGFLSPHLYAISVSLHAWERMTERMGVVSEDVKALAYDAYRFGRSKRQLKATSAALVEEIENRHGDGIVLIYKNYIYIFSRDNTLKTVYKNESIPV